MSSYLLALPEIFCRKVVGFQPHALDLLVGQAVSGLDFNLRLFTAALLPCRYLQDSVGVDEKLHFNTRQPRRHWRG